MKAANLERQTASEPALETAAFEFAGAILSYFEGDAVRGMRWPVYEGKAPGNDARSRGMSLRSAEPMVKLKDLREAFGVLCPVCDKAVRNVLLEKLSVARKPQILALCDLRKLVAADWSIPEQMLSAGEKTQTLADARRDFCRRAKKQGYSSPEIATAINRHHSSVLYLLRSGR